MSIDDVRAGARTALGALEDRVFDVTYAEFSKEDRAFLAAMLPDGEPTTRAHLTERLNKL